ncbi:MAG: efflux RND transporter periplasmic adaptor subunit [Calditrichia bacterium]|nr:efflux RND transporter periplasmic adaptor subunit [Calditrichia bacterium]
MKSKKKIIILIVVSLIVIAGIIAIAMTSGEKGVRVTVEKVNRGDITEIVTGSGKIYPVIEVQISAKVAGEIIHLQLEEGETVTKGQVLVKLDREQYKAAVARSSSYELSTQAGFRLAKTEYTRIKELFDQKLVSESEYEQALARKEEADANLKQAQASLNEAQDALDKTIIRSPIDGIIIQKNKEQGEIALGSQFQADVILVVADLSSIEARIEVNENDIPKLSLYDPSEITIDAFPDSTFKGKVSQIAHSPVIKGLGTADEVTNYLVHILIKDKLDAFRSGMSCIADAQTETHKNVLRVPIQAVTVREPKELKIEKPEEDNTDAQNNPENYEKPEFEEVVFVFNEGKAFRKAVKLGLADDNFYEIIDGVEEDEEIITGPFRVLSQTLKDENLVYISKVGKKKDKD